MKRRAVLGWLALSGQLASASTEELRAAILLYTAGVEPRPGGVQIDIAPLVENGNAVPVTLRVDDSPMRPDDHVQGIALFNQLNPQRDVARFTLTPASGKAQVATRIRLATSQQLVVVARLSDGSYRSQAVDVVVTLAACVE